VLHLQPAGLLRQAVQISGFHHRREETAMKTFHCGSLVPGCEWHTRSDSEAEIVSRAIDHLRQTHGETTIRPSIVEQIKERTLEETDAA